ncbi:MAG: hypothetical protein KDA69_10925 [Planctomycetaceae bacterium]|nr:hypothetical protein [Planctomycetaceae bacterium]MCA9044825.1 hypothetical protein [Planctomycetaceae bacterium]
MMLNPCQFVLLASWTACDENNANAPPNAYSLAVEAKGFPLCSIEIETMERLPLVSNPGSHNYFPPGTIGANEELGNGAGNSWYGMHLISMNESPLWKRDAPVPTTYRFLYVPTFSNPFMIRVQNDEARQDWSVTAKVTNCRAGFFSGPLTTNATTTDNQRNDNIG